MPLAVNRFLPADYTKIAKICERMPRNRFITSKKARLFHLRFRLILDKCVVL